jgi:hypothetical protein
MAGAMQLHKIEVAARQLDTAITLFLSDGEPCSIITLAAASEEVLGNYVDGTWTPDNPNNMFNRMFKAAQARGLQFRTKAEFSQNLVNRTKNALKHADRPEEQHVSIHPEEPVVRLLHALINYQLGSGKQFTEPMNRFEAWVRSERREYLNANGSTDAAAT